MERWRILAIDDDLDTLNFIRIALAEKYDVMTVVDPQETPEALSIFEPDLMVLDIMMPKVSGFQLLEYLNHHDQFVDMPVVIISAKNSTSDIKYGYKLGANTYLTKPFTRERLIKNIDLIFDRTPPPKQKKKYSISQVGKKVKLKKELRLGTAVFGKNGKSVEEHIRTESPRGTQKEEEGKSAFDTWVD